MPESIKDKVLILGVGCSERWSAGSERRIASVDDIEDAVRLGLGHSYGSLSLGDRIGGDKSAVDPQQHALPHRRSPLPPKPVAGAPRHGEAVMNPSWPLWRSMLFVPARHDAGSYVADCADRARADAAK
jgi:hypothetical protein